MYQKECCTPKLFFFVAYFSLNLFCFDVLLAITAVTSLLPNVSFLVGTIFRRSL